MPSKPGEDCIVVEIDSGMVPVVQSDPTSPDQRKKKTLEWKELKLCSARELGSVSPVYGGTFSGGVEAAGKQLYHCTCQAGLGQMPIGIIKQVRRWLKLLLHHFESHPL